MKRAEWLHRRQQPKQYTDMIKKPDLYSSEKRRNDNFRLYSDRSNRSLRVQPALDSKRLRGPIDSTLDFFTPNPNSQFMKRIVLKSEREWPVHRQKKLVSDACLIRENIVTQVSQVSRAHKGDTALVHTVADCCQ